MSTVAAPPPRRLRVMLALAGTPSGSSWTELRSVDDPVPRQDQVLIDVRAFSVNRGELTLLRRRPDGWRPGQDVAGFVVSAAADGSGPEQGSRVVAIVEWEGWAQRVAAPARRLAVLPDTVSFEQAASLPIAGLTALRTLRLGGPLLGRRVLVTGASGAVGRFAVELAANAGAVVTAVARSGDGLADVGAGEVVADIERASGPYDLILESVGGTSLSTAVSLVAPRGVIVVLGNSSGSATPINFRDFHGHEDARLQTFFSYYQGEDFTPDLALLVDLVATGRLHPPLAHVDSWRNANDALDRLAAREVRGKVVLRVD